MAPAFWTNIEMSGDAHAGLTVNAMRHAMDFVYRDLAALKTGAGRHGSERKTQGLPFDTRQ